MEQKHMLIALAIVLVVLIAAYLAYRRKWLNAELPASWQYDPASGSAASAKTS